MDGMANSGELLINVVRSSKPKALRGLNQKRYVARYRGVSLPLSSLSEPPAERQSLNHP